MTLSTIIIQVLLTIPLTILLNYFNNKENRRLNQILIPSIYIILISALLPSIKENIFLIVIFEIFIRNFYVTNITNRQVETSVFTFIIESILSIALSLFTYNYFINQVATVIPNPEEIKGFIWFLIILYIANLYKVNSQNKVVKEKTQNIKRKKEKTIMQYAKFKNMYSQIVNSSEDMINNLTYATMIYEDYKTPKFYRNINSYIGAVTKKETKYGIMQIPSYTRLSDDESIKMVIENFENKKKESKLKDNELLSELLNNYSEDSKKDILSIYNEILEFTQK